MRTTATALLFVLTIGCSKPLDPPPAPLTITQRIFEPVYRASKALQGATTSGVTMIQFSQLMQALSTEIAIAKDQQMNELDKKLIALYDEAFGAYQFSSALWSAKIEASSDTWGGEIPVGINGKVDPALEAGLKRFGVDPQPRTMRYTGTKYHAVPAESVQVAWAKADESLAKATEMYYGRTTAPGKGAK